MNILINATTLTAGGGVQVGDSIFRELNKANKHHFYVVYPSELEQSAKDIEGYGNVTLCRYDNIWVKRGVLEKIHIFLTGRDSFLDDIVKNNNIEAVFTIFAPAIWKPRCLHICGFARSQLLISDSPFWKNMNRYRRAKIKIRVKMKLYIFRRGVDIFYTENQYISLKLKSIYKNLNVYTVTNYYNNVFDKPESWDCSIILPPFEGVTMLTISANYVHKNLPIIIPTIHYLKGKYPGLRFRFVLTINEEQFPALTEEEKKHVLFVGPVKISQCPYLYGQCDIMFLPTLLECFSASYAEAMRMNVPILTTDLEFAHSLCGEAAKYYSAMSSDALGDAIYELSSMPELRAQLIANGVKQLQTFDTYEERAQKLIGIVEQEYDKKMTLG